jgi:pyruvate formate lyase activating enzyme
MRIGGLLKQSFIDWDSRMVAVVFTQGCNFRCGYCHNPSLVIPQLIAKSDGIPEDEVLQFLASRCGWLEGVVVSGGEPTLQPDLKLFITGIKEMGYSVKLDTNGTNPELLAELIAEHLVDYVAMDIKTIPQYSRYAQVTPISTTVFDKVQQSIALLQQGNIAYQFRTTIIPNHHTTEDIAQLKEQMASCPSYRMQEYRKGDTVECYL